MTSPPPLPPPPRRKRTWLAWILVPLGSILFSAFIGFVVIFLLFAAPYLPMFQHREAPSGWRRPKVESVPPDAAFVGTWAPMEPGLTIPFANGEPHTVAPTDTLELHPDGTYQATHRGIYDGRSHLICLRSETGQWSTVRDTSLGQPPDVVLRADLPSIRVEHRVIPDFNMDNVNYNQMIFAQQHPGEMMNQSTEEIDDMDNAMNCSSAAPRDLQYEWGIITRNGKLGIFHDAPAMAYESTVFPWHIVPVKQVAYEKK